MSHFRPPYPLNKTPIKKNDEFINNFRSYDFIGKQEARYLLETLKSPSVLSMLPREASDIIMVTINNQFRDQPTIILTLMFTKRKTSIMEK